MAIVEKSNLSNSPFRYPGGKFYARRLILASLPVHENYCEPFAGGASIFFAKPLGGENILNDKDEELINTYLVIRDNVEELIALLKGLPATKVIHKYYKIEYKPSNNIERAMRWYYLNRTSYSGIMKIENCYWGYGDKYSMRPENWPRHLRTVSERLQGVTILNQDFETVIDSLPDGYFMFVDPPYFNADQDKFYTCSFSKDDHYRLRDVLRRNSTRLDFLLTYDNLPEIRELYNWCTSLEDREWNYTISRTDDQKNRLKLADGHEGTRYKGKEVFIANYSLRMVQPIRQESLFAASAAD
jgi:DNA adenine methylase